MGRLGDHGRPGWRRMGRLSKGRVVATVRHLRERFGDGLTIAASGGLHEPADALDLQDAGANLVAIDSGLVYSGPASPSGSTTQSSTSTKPRRLAGPGESGRRSSHGSGSVSSVSACSWAV